jgi:hypothetical protein
MSETEDLIHEATRRTTKTDVKFQVDQQRLYRLRPLFHQHRRLYWLIGGAGSGKSTLCRTLSEKTGMPIYDMDAHIYGEYQERFTRRQHPVNYAWISAENGLTWQLSMSWDEFDSFNRAALPEYLDLFAQDLVPRNLENGLIVDGGIFNPAVLTQVFPAQRIVCLARPERTSVEIWEGDEERLAMKGFIQQLPDGEAAWRRFLDFDERVTQTILGESRENGIAILPRSEMERVDLLAERVASVLDID